MKTSKGIENLNTNDQLDLIGIYRTLHPTIAEYKFFATTHKIFTKIKPHLILCHKVVTINYE